MHLTRAELAAGVAALERAAAADDREWIPGSDRLTGSAAPDDVEWLADRLQDAAFHLGHTFDDACSRRRLLAQGRAYFEDEEQAPAPHPRFALFQVHGSPGALDTLAGGGGTGPLTWGFDRTSELAWLALAAPGASDDDWRSAITCFEGELAAAGIRLGSDP